jgi:hypothetical protein
VSDHGDGLNREAKQWKKYRKYSTVNRNKSLFGEEADRRNKSTYKCGKANKEIDYCSKLYGDMAVLSSQLAYARSTWRWRNANGELRRNEINAIPMVASCGSRNVKGEKQNLSRAL